MIAIAAAELKMLVRNKLVAFSALLMPFLFAFVFMQMGDSIGGSFAVASFVVSVVSTVIYLTGTTTLAARRQNLFLKRMRSTATRDASIIAGLLAPTVVLAAIQLTVIMVGMTVVQGEGMANPALIAAAVILGIVTFAGLALATTGVTNSPEHAQVTTLPVFFIAIGAAVWSGIGAQVEGDDVIPGLIRAALPGGGVAELVRLGWDGGAFAEALPALIGTAAWAVLALVIARRMFRWEPRV